MRNWNLKGISHFLDSLEVFTVPMRNWNIIKIIVKERWYMGFYSTYEELKPLYCFFTIDNNSLFLQYLWGIETSFICIRGKQISMFLQYLWGIETKSPMFFPPFYNSFYSTYEELKLTYLPSFNFVMPCFYSTYEELKLLPSHFLPVPMTCFYSTYEELKPHFF